MEEALKTVLDRLEFYCDMMPVMVDRPDDYWETLEGGVTLRAIRSGREALKTAGVEYESHATTIPE